MPKSCPECRFADGSCRQFVIGHPNPVCVAGYPQRVTLSDGLADEMDVLDLLIPAPRLSPENLRVR
ncbi:hypothetical protein [Actinophytocola algeriensis]|uniref:Uncharacterized protein n=1 Tax=Actinophytocola algeriensis TaxID=1768010 RepID=A0A7W7QEK4_9PSEU|nr:hypothetical protein [Actinophytocola algeriensis]MBB4912130.1 hypothetical protein [Actinophytocola algeriensis]MBE1477378.1 hypothetical protein [Actinophytocola algeriensis]